MDPQRSLLELAVPQWEAVIVNIVNFTTTSKPFSQASWGRLDMKPNRNKRKPKLEQTCLRYIKKKKTLDKKVKIINNIHMQYTEAYMHIIQQ
jgi:hypothetical protein